jgi:transposase-like protein
LSGDEAQGREWPKLVARWEASGESAAVFASHVGTKAVTLYRWRRELRRAATTSGLTLAKIVEVRPAPLAADDRFEVRLGEGRSVGVPPAFEAGALERLLHVLEAAR